MTTTVRREAHVLSDPTLLRALDDVREALEAIEACCYPTTGAGEGRAPNKPESSPPRGRAVNARRVQGVTRTYVAKLTAIVEEWEHPKRQEHSNPYAEQVKPRQTPLVRDSSGRIRLSRTHLEAKMRYALGQDEPTA